MDLSALISYFLKSKQNLSFRQTQTLKAEQQTLPQFITQKKWEFHLHYGAYFFFPLLKLAISYFFSTPEVTFRNDFNHTA